MSKLNQRSATIQVILATLTARSYSYELNGSTSISSVLTDSDKENVRNTLFSMFRNGQVELSSDASDKFSDDSKLKAYISGLVNNWIRKAPEFNGGMKYQAKNPGSRQGSGDQQVREMKKLLSATQDPTTKAVIQSEIEKRLGEIKVTKAAVEIDSSKLPESLRHLVKA